MAPCQKNSVQEARLLIGRERSPARPMRMPDQRFAGSRLKTASLHLCPALERQNVEAERLNKTSTIDNLILTFEKCLLHHPAAEYFQFENPNAFLPPYLDIIGGRKEETASEIVFVIRKLTTTTLYRWAQGVEEKWRLGHL